MKEKGTETSVAVVPEFPKIIPKIIASSPTLTVIGIEGKGNRNRFPKDLTINGDLNIPISLTFSSNDWISGTYFLGLLALSLVHDSLPGTLEQLKEE